MPNGDHMEPTEAEDESRCICQLIEYVYEYIQKTLPNWVHDAARDDYGDSGRLEKAKEMLGRCLKSLTHDELEALVYDAHKSESRKLADWWERYQEEEKRDTTDKKQVKALLRESALKKLTPAEVEALDID